MWHHNNGKKKHTNSTFGFPSNSASCLLKKRKSGKNPNRFFGLLLLQYLASSSEGVPEASSLHEQPELSADPSTFSWWASHVFPFTFALSSGKNFGQFIPRRGDGRWLRKIPWIFWGEKIERQRSYWRYTHFSLNHDSGTGRKSSLYLIPRFSRTCHYFMQKWHVACLPRLTVLANVQAHNSWANLSNINGNVNRNFIPRLTSGSSYFVCGNDSIHWYVQ